MAHVWSDIATEFLHLYPSGPRLLAVAGTDAERSRGVAGEVAAALAAAGQRTERVHTADGDEDALRSDVIAPFRADRSDRVLVVSGPAALLSASARGLWNFTIGQISGDEQPHTAASAIIDVTNPANPHRRFQDFCALPSAFGA